MALSYNEWKVKNWDYLDGIPEAEWRNMYQAYLGQCAAYKREMEYGCQNPR